MASSATPHGANALLVLLSDLPLVMRKVTHYKIKNAYGTSIFYGDFVKVG